MRNCRISNRLIGSTIVLILATVIVFADSASAATWTGQYCQGGHWTDLPITFKFVNPGDKCTTTSHPGKNWTEAEKNVARAAIKEYNQSDTGLNGKIKEEINCTKTADITIRWEYEKLKDGTPGFFRNWHNDNVTHRRFCNWENLSDCTTGYWNGPRGDESTWIPEGNPDPNGCRPFPQNEIYLNANKTWFVDPTPNSDEEFDANGYMLNPNQLDLYTIIKHEFGHALGYSTHSADASDVMATSGASSKWEDDHYHYRRRRPTSRDIGQLQKLYGKQVSDIPYLRHGPQSDSCTSPGVPAMGSRQTLKMISASSRIYLRFNLGLCPYGIFINSAKIWLYLNNTDGVPQSLTMCKVSDSWDEDTLTSANAPPLVSAVDTITVNSSGWYGWNVRDYAREEYQGDKTLSIAIATSESGNKGFFSREAPRGDSVVRGDGNVPYIEIEYSGVGGILVPFDRFGLPTPYIGLASTIIIAIVSTLVCLKQVKAKKEKK